MINGYCYSIDCDDDHCRCGDKVTDYHDFCSISTPIEDRRKFDVGDIWINASICLVCGDFIRSRNRHDYRTCSCKNISVDGGSWYAKRVGSLKNYQDVVIPFNEVEND